MLAIPTGQALVLHEVWDLSAATKTYFDGRHFAFSVTDENFHAIVAKLEKRGLKQGDVLGGNVPSQARRSRHLFSRPDQRHAYSTAQQRLQ